MSKAWLGAKYVIEHAPPPVAGDDAFTLVTPGATLAGPEDTAFAVLTMQDAVAATTVALVDTAHGALVGALSTSIFAAMNARDEAIKYIHAIPVPPPPVDDSIVDARMSGAPVGSSWATVMPNLIPQLDDEIQEINAMQENKALSTGARRVLNAAELQATETEKQVNLWWPPLPPGD